MKNSKWLLPSLIIIIFCIVLFISNSFVLNLIHNFRERQKESRIEEERSLAYVEEESFESNLSNITDIQMGESYTAILKEDGSVWVSGVNKSYASDYTYEGIQKNEFTKMRIEDIKQIEVGSDFVIALKENGEVYSWGANSYSTLGIEGASNRPYQVPRKLSIDNIEKIYVFGNQVAALSKDQTAYYWGYAVDDYKTQAPQKLDIDKKIQEIYLIQHQYYFKTVDNEIYAIGYDFEGLTTQQNGWARIPIIMPIQNVEKIISYEGYENSGSQNNKYIIKTDGTVWKLDTINATTETKIEGLENIENIYPYRKLAAGQEGMNFLAVDKNGDIYKYNPGTIQKLDIQGVKNIIAEDDMVILQKKDGTIWNLETSIETLKGNLPSNVQTYYSSPKQIDVSNIKLVALNENSMIAVGEDNSIYRQGDNSSGQLGAGEKKICADLEVFNYTEIITDPSMDTIAD